MKDRTFLERWIPLALAVLMTVFSIISSVALVNARGQATKAKADLVQAHKEKGALEEKVAVLEKTAGALVHKMNEVDKAWREAAEPAMDLYDRQLSYVHSYAVDRVSTDMTSEDLRLALRPCEWKPKASGCSLYHGEDVPIYIGVLKTSPAPTPSYRNPPSIVPQTKPRD